MSVARDSVKAMTVTPAFRAPEQAHRAVTLDESQRAVVALGATESASVLGAAGTGKTATLIEFVADRVERLGLSADHILVLTPQRLAANRLRLALGERLRVATNGPLARTPMSLAFSLAVDGAFSRGVEPPSMLTGSEQDAILASLLALETSSVAWPEQLAYDTRQSRTFRSELRDLYSRCIDHGWGPSELASIARERGGENQSAWMAAAQFWQNEYEPVLADSRTNHFDIATLLRQGAVALSDPAVMPQVRLVVIDDAQELTRGSLGILRAFAARGIPIVLFGDPDTSATTFRGADPTLIGSLTDVVPGARSLTLSTVHRQGGLAHSLLSAVTGRVGAAKAGSQRAARPSALSPATSLEIIERATGISELTAIARRLREFHVYEQIPYSRMAVVLRSGSQVNEVARVLAVSEVSTRTLISDRTLKDQTIVRDLLRVVEVGIGHRSLDSQTANDMLLSPVCGLSIIEVRRLRQALRHDELAHEGVRTGVQLLPLALTGDVPVAHISMRAAKKAQGLGNLLSELRAMGSSTIEELLWKVWSWSRLADIWLAESHGFGVIADEANRNLDAVLALFTAAKRFVEREPHSPAAEFIRSVFASDVPEDTLSSQGDTDAVLVSTSAALIGAEFDVVVVASVQEGRWPNLRPRGSLLHAPDLDEQPSQVDSRKQVLDDELRMFALAISRASKHVILTATAGLDDAPSPLVRLAAEIKGVETDARHASDVYPLSLRGMTGVLRRELTRTLRDEPASSEQALEYARALAALARAEVPGADPAQWYGLIDPSTLEPLANLDKPEGERDLVKVNPSSLESWKKNQLGWFLNSTVSWQGSSATGIGALVHEVFEDSVLRPELSIDPDQMWKRIEPRWAELGLEPEWVSELEKKRVRKMLGALAAYILDFRAAGKTVLGVESKFEMAVGRGMLSGKVDRLEQNLDGSITVVDLKTSKNPITKDEASEHIQLACYQFALVNDAFAHLEGMPEKPVSQGATLLYLNKKMGDDFGYQSRNQNPFEREDSSAVTGDPLTAAQMRTLIEEAVESMAGSVFTAIVYTREERGEYDSSWEKRIHVIQAVSA